MTDYFSQEQFSELNSEGFTLESLNRFAEIVVAKSIEEFLKALPSVISHLISSAAVMKTVADNFYKENSDLNEHRLIVAKAIESIELNNPGAKIEELLKLAAPIARRNIKKADNVNNVVNPQSINDIDSELGVL